MITIVIFASSLFLALLILILKSIESKRGKPDALLALVNLLNPKVEKFIEAFKFKCLQIIQTVRYVVLIKTREYIEDLISQVQEKFFNAYKVRQEILMGRKHIMNKGSVSFYLKKVAEYKGNGIKGKIEESL